MAWLLLIALGALPLAAPATNSSLNLSLSSLATTHCQVELAAGTSALGALVVSSAFLLACALTLIQHLICADASRTLSACKSKDGRGICFTLSDASGEFIFDSLDTAFWVDGASTCKVSSPRCGAHTRFTLCLCEHKSHLRERSMTIPVLSPPAAETNRQQ